MALILRSTKGEPLTAAEHDANLSELQAGYMGVMLEDTDMDSVIVGGRYGVIGSGNTNAPTAGEFALDVTTDGTRVMQIYTSPLGAIYVRVYASSSWSAYTQVSGGGFDYFVSSTEPKTASFGDVWEDTTNGVLYVYTSAIGFTPVNVGVGGSKIRPVLYAPCGIPYFDTDIGKPVWFDGAGWVDATGATA